MSLRFGTHFPSDLAQQLRILESLRDQTQLVHDLTLRLAFLVSQHPQGLGLCELSPDGFELKIPALFHELSKQPTLYRKFAISGRLVEAYNASPKKGHPIKLDLTQYKVVLESFSPLLELLKLLVLGLNYSPVNT